MEPSSVEGLLLAKIAGGIAGLIGGLSLATMWLPERFKKHGKMAAGATIGGISVGSAMTLGGLVASLFNLDPRSLDVALGIGFLVGAVSVGCINLIANYFAAREEDDVIDAVQELIPSKVAKPKGKESV